MVVRVVSSTVVSKGELDLALGVTILEDEPGNDKEETVYQGRGRGSVILCVSIIASKTSPRRVFCTKAIKTEK